MRRSLFLRLLGLSLAVAVFAIGATAWLTTRETSERFRGEFERTLEADTFLYLQLASYASAHDSWDDVEQTVAELAERTGRRVALTTMDGDVVADSAGAAGDGAPPLPSAPTAEIDAVAAGDSGLSATSVAIDELQGTEMESTVPAGGELMSPLLGTASTSIVAVGAAPIYDVSPTWRMSDAELERRKRLTQDAEECLQKALGTDDDVVVSIGGEVFSVHTSGDSDGTADVFQSVEDVPGASGDVLDRCVPEVLYEPSEPAQELNDDLVRRTSECLDEAGVPYSVVRNGNGMKVVVPEATTGGSDGETDGAPVAPPGAVDADPVAMECMNTAWEEAMGAFVAEPALLYTGGEERFNPFVGDGLGRTLVAGGAVLAVVTGVTVFGGRRLTRPIRALTDAARRMGAGEFGTRVHTSGKDEVAQLAGAFNSMAASIEANEAQRRAMISDVAHELRTPLSNVQGYLEAAEDGVVPLDPELVRSLLEESALLRRLIDDLQDLALADAGMLRFDPESRDLVDLARQVVGSHRAGADDAGVALSVDQPDDDGSPVTVWADPERVRQALSNLVGNAVRFTPEGGRVTVSVRREGDAAVLAVDDNGTGIPAEHLPRLFDRFYRVEGSRSRETGGSGLGLAITKHLVEAQGGSIEVESTEGVGSVFTITLPLHNPVVAD
ncbi:sensor histidine kinase [Phytoactinopolyspora halotolerans]|uniref:histidine kinase n=1 Tax=Phytoactinopolyspora halotolerans TaxID=1981512 RepID=A0A6L9S1B3_9ACTN|nr:ATP-binding protein [Phytoactinopolyspora halotolerans]NED98768.1 HAMP domain-containing protein [Phytoactinopolyspora halotolerans]